jgi:branched chain amino acid efflux pump
VTWTASKVWFMSGSSVGRRPGVDGSCGRYEEGIPQTFRPEHQSAGAGKAGGRTNEHGVAMTMPMYAQPPVSTAADLRAEFWSGMRDMLPLLVGLTPFGLLVGAAVGASLDPLAAWAGALPIYGGSAQLAVLGPLGQGSGLLVAVAAGVLVNLRVIVYSSALAPLWSQSRWWARALAAATVIDPTWAMAEQRATRPGTLTERRAHYAGAAAVLTLGWLVLVTAGAMGGALAGGTTVLGAALPLCLLELLVPHLSRRPGAAAVAVAATVVLATSSLPSGVGLLLAMGAAGATGAVVERRVRP